MTFRIQKNWRWLVALGAVFVPCIVSGALSLPFTFSAGTPIKAAEVNANFEALRSKLDALSSTPSLPTVGTLTLPGVVSAVPIRKFTQSLTLPFTLVAGAASGKVQAADIEVVRDVGAGSPVINLDLNQNKALATADIVVGGFTAHLKTVTITSVKVAPPEGDRPQEVITLSFASIDWTIQSGTNPARTVSFDRVQNTGGNATVLALKYGFAPAGVPLDPTFTRFTAYTHAMACPSSGAAGTACKSTVGPLSVQKGVGPETIDDLGHVVSGKSGNSVDLEWFSAASTVNNSVKLTNATVVNVLLTTQADGSFTEAVDFGFTSITWQAGTSVSTWDLLANKGA